MLGKIKTSLKRLYGRFKNKMADWFMSYAGSYTPLGMVIWLFTYENLKGGAYWVGIVAGTIMVIAGIVALLISWGEVKRERVKKREERDENNKKFALLMNEIRKLREEFNNRGEINDKEKPIDKPKT